MKTFRRSYDGYSLWGLLFLSTLVFAGLCWFDNENEFFHPKPPETEGRVGRLIGFVSKAPEHQMHPLRQFGAWLGSFREPLLKDEEYTDLRKGISIAALFIVLVLFLKLRS